MDSAGNSMTGGRKTATVVSVCWAKLTDDVTVALVRPSASVDQTDNSWMPGDIAGNCLDISPALSEAAVPIVLPSSRATTSDPGAVLTFSVRAVSPTPMLTTALP